MLVQLSSPDWGNKGFINILIRTTAAAEMFQQICFVSVFGYIIAITIITIFQHIYFNFLLI